MASQTAQEQISLAEITSSSAWKLTPATLAHTLSAGLWLPAAHLMYISARIASGIHKGNARIIVSLPPRHGKSELLSIYTPIWFLEHFPHKQVMLTSYGAELANDFGRRVRDTINENAGGKLSVRLRQDAQKVDRFLTTRNGGLIAAGIGGPITGRGADVLLVDDYVKNTEEAESITQRNKAYDWLISTVYPRLEPDASIIIVATRWNIDDVIGRLTLSSGSYEDTFEELIDPNSPERLEALGEEWEVINIPAVARENDVLGRAVGEPLWSTRYPLKRLNAIKNILGTYFWEALYQQSPMPRTASAGQEGWLQVEDIAPHRNHMRHIRFWDLGATAEGGDYTVGLKMGKHMDSGLYHILDIVRGQWSAGEVEERVAATAKQDSTDTLIVLEQEPGSSGKALVAHYVKDVLPGYAVIGKPSTGDKFVRAQPVFAAAKAGLLRMLKSHWNRNLVDEFRLFPDAPHDDQIDALSGCFNELNAARFKGVTWGRTQEQSRPRPGLLATGATFGRNK